MTLELGDMVQVHRPGDPQHGSTGQIVEIAGDMLCVLDGNNRWRWYSAGELHHQVMCRQMTVPPEGIA